MHQVDFASMQIVHKWLIDDLSSAIAANKEVNPEKARWVQNC